MGYGDEGHTERFALNTIPRAVLANATIGLYDRRLLEGKYTVLGYHHIPTDMQQQQDCIYSGATCGDNMHYSSGGHH